MKNKITIIYIVLLFIAVACNPSKRIVKRVHVMQLTQSERVKESDLFTQAVILEVIGKYTEADKMMQKALAINNDDPAANYEEGRILLQLNRADEAMVFAKKATSLDENNKWYKKFYADMAKVNGDYKEYVKEYSELAEQYPSDLNFLNELAFAYYFTGDYKNAVKQYLKIEQGMGVSEMLTKQIAELYTRLNEPDKAIETFQKLINAFPDETRYYAMLAEYSTKHNMPQKAEQAYKKIIQLNPKDPYVHISLADFYRKAGKKEEAFDELKMGFANPELDLKTKINLLLNYYSGKLTDKQRTQALVLSEILKKVYPGKNLSKAFYATMLYENKKYKEAEKITRIILKTNRNNYAMWEQLLFSELYLQRNDSLIVDADTVVNLFPNQPVPYLLGGIASFQTKDFTKAKKFLETGKNLVVNNNALLEQFYSSLGDTYNELKMYQKSYNAYDSVLTLNPNNAVVLNNYAYYLSLRSKNLVKAENMAKKAVQLDPYNQNNLDTYAWVFYMAKKYKEALKWEQKALDNGGTKSGIVLEHMGDILYQLGKKDKALQMWIKAKTKKDHSDLLHKKIKNKKLYE